MSIERLHFGTAGLRGPVRDGIDAMNRATVRQATAALARWLIDNGQPGATVVIGRDARHGSAEFFDETTMVLRGAGFDVIGIADPLPTPVTAFATRHVGAAAGIMITASHNPPADNGYKVYLGGDAITAGAQLVPPADAEIEALIDDPRTAQHAEEFAATGMTRPVAHDPRVTEIVTAYHQSLSDRVPHAARDITVALTPMHGIGGETARAALHNAGFTNVVVVEQQFSPDPDFPTVAFPNPEEPGASDLLLSLAETSGADIAIALDPDADRCAVGTVVDGRWRMLTGDETGALLAATVLAQTHQPDPLVATTIVSGSMLTAIADAAGARSERTLTGFKWLVRAGDNLVYAYEEAIGHCVDPSVVRDKDGISAALVLAELADRLHRDQRTLADALTDLYATHGVHRTAQVSLRSDSNAEREAIMARLRTNPPARIAGITAHSSDFAARDDALRTDAIRLEGNDGGVRVSMMVRPSGTEPKIKVYLEVAYTPGDTAANSVAAQHLMDALISDAQAPR